MATVKKDNKEKPDAKAWRPGFRRDEKKGNNPTYDNPEINIGKKSPTKEQESIREELVRLFYSITDAEGQPSKRQFVLEKRFQGDRFVERVLRLPDGTKTENAQYLSIHDFNELYVLSQSGELNSEYLDSLKSREEYDGKNGVLIWWRAAPEKNGKKRIYMKRYEICDRL